jgi:deazaflavin-dependent oxidoreductase (nitroreductase family)
VADSAPGRASDFNTEMIEEFRANGGRVGGPWAGTTLILIHHIGARSGTERVTPLGCSRQGDGSFAIVASNGGSPAHPYHNLKANRSLTPSDSEYRLGGRLRTVFGRLVARRGPVRPAGLAAWWLPGVSWGVGFPWCGLGVGGFPGSRLGWPHCVRWGGAVPCRATPGPVAKSASPQHQRRSVVPGELWMVLPQGGEPVERPPAR